MENKKEYVMRELTVDEKKMILDDATHFTEQIYKHAYNLNKRDGSLVAINFALHVSSIVSANFVALSSSIGDDGMKNKDFDKESIDICIHTLIEHILSILKYSDFRKIEDFKSH